MFYLLFSSLREKKANNCQAFFYHLLYCMHASIHLVHHRVGSNQLQPLIPLAIHKYKVSTYISILLPSLTTSRKLPATHVASPRTYGAYTIQLPHPQLGILTYPVTAPTSHPIQDLHQAYLQARCRRRRRMSGTIMPKLKVPRHRRLERHRRRRRIMGISEG